jgi:hypothetical protein
MPYKHRHIVVETPIDVKNIALSTASVAKITIMIFRGSIDFAGIP